MWQPIETAPKDGSNILICGEGDDGYFVADVKWNEKEGEFCLFDPAEDTYSYPTYRPSHWMPLPNPPAEKAQEPSEVTIRRDRSDWPDKQENTE